MEELLRAILEPTIAVLMIRSYSVTIVTGAVVTAVGIMTSMLTASIIGGTLINIYTCQ